MPKKKKAKFNFKTIYLLVFAIFLFAASLFWTNKSSTPVLTGIPSISNTFENEISQETIEISGVKVADFINESEIREKPDYYTLYRGSGYHLFFIPNQELFYISVTSYPFDDIKPKAEQQFLQSLDISQKEACKLNVDITTTSFANPDKAGKVYDLSFCE